VAVPRLNLQQEAAEKGGSGIAVIHCRFYDLAGWKATLFPMPAKSRRPDKTVREKAWLTFSGYQSLIGCGACHRVCRAAHERPIENGLHQDGD
jgi:hypothetical protein